MREQLIELLKTLPADRHLEFPSDDRAKIICPNPNHAGGHERTASFHISLVEGPLCGASYCFGCRAGGGWTRFTAEALGFKKFARSLKSEVATNVFSESTVAEMLGKSKSGKMPSNTEDWPVEEDWRSISSRLVIDVGGKLELGGFKPEPALILPAYMRKKLRGFVRCRVHPSDTELNYVNAGPRDGFVKWAQDALFPYDFVRNTLDGFEGPRVVIGVEGARDALKTIQNGALALATLGATNWSDKCVAAVKALSPDVFICMGDPDEAGDLLNEMMYESLRPIMRTKIIRLPYRMVRKTNSQGVSKKVKQKKIDPGDMSRRQLAKALAAAGVDLEQIDCTSARYQPKRKKHDE